MSQPGVRRTGGVIEPAELAKYQAQIEAIQTVTSLSSVDCYRELQNTGFNADAVVARFLDGRWLFIGSARV